MAGYREKVIHLMQGAVRLLPHRLLQRLSGQRWILPTYHVISDVELPHIKHLYAVKGTRAFEDDLDFLLKYYEPVDYHTFRALAKEQASPPKPAFLLSFDDGLREFHDVIAPILRRKGIPAICFLNSGFVDNKDLFYRHKASLLMDIIQTKAHLGTVMADLFDQPDNIAHSLLSVGYEQKELLDLAAERLDVSFEDFLAKEKPYLTTTQVERLLEQGFQFGAHSVDHPEYQYIDFDQQVEQTRESVADVCGKFSLNYRIFAFPFTDYKVSRRFFDHLAEKNIVDCTFGCAGQKSDEAPNHFQRIQFEMAHLSGRGIASAELLYYLMKMPFGKNVIRRT